MDILNTRKLGEKIEQYYRTNQKNNWDNNVDLSADLDFISWLCVY